jgi:hypothetical protein
MDIVHYAIFEIHFCQGIQAVRVLPPLSRCAKNARSDSPCDAKKNHSGVGHEGMSLWVDLPRRQKISLYLDKGVQSDYILRDLSFLHIVLLPPVT